MARYIGSSCKVCRREGAKLFLKGNKCSTEKCPFSRRPYPPGQHGRKPQRKHSYYALQLREKQKVKNMYGVLERQFKRYYTIAQKRKGETGRILIQILERRLDNVIFRACCALSRNQARQFARHNFFKINGKKVNIPSYTVRVGDVLTMDDESKRKIVKENLDSLEKTRSVAGWLDLNKDALTITVQRLPEKEDLVIPVKEQLIVELYSK